MPAAADATLAEIFDRTADVHPEGEFVVRRGLRLTYRDVRSRADRLAAFLSGGFVSPGDCVALLLDNSPEYVISYFAIMKAGGIVVPLSGNVPDRSLVSVMCDFAPGIVVATPAVAGRLAGLAEKRELPSLRSVVTLSSKRDEAALADESSRRRIMGGVEIVPVDAVLAGNMEPRCVPGGVARKADDLAMIIYTSGTTGNPKGVMLTHRNLVSNARSIVKYLRLSHADRVMVVLPFYYSYGNSLLTTHAMVGGAMVLEDSLMYPNVVLNTMVTERVTGFSGVPSTFAILLNKSRIASMRFPELRYVAQAGGAMSPRHARELKAALPGVDIFIMYGQTEATARLSYLEPGDLQRKAGSIGKAIPGVTLSLEDENGKTVGTGEVGEIVATGENIMAGYYGMPEETARVLRNGALHTGDYARVDEEGYLYIVGRRTDMIKSGGHRISTKEIEEILLEMPQVEEAAVVGVEDEILGEALLSYIVVKERESLTAREVRAHCAKNLPSHKVPQHVKFIDRIPKTDSGKPRKFAIGK